jgi:hypothetical protein
VPVDTFSIDAIKAEVPDGTPLTLTVEASPSEKPRQAGGTRRRSARAALDGQSEYLVRGPPP